jgi:hypothetical protein
MAVALFVFGLVVDGSFYVRTNQSPQTEVPNALRRMGEQLRENVRDDDVLATDMAGILPYYARVRTIDTFGLCDRYIAKHG